MGNYGIFLIVWVMQDLYHQPYQQNQAFLERVCRGSGFDWGVLRVPLGL